MQPLLEQLTRLQSLSLEHSGSPCARRSSTTAAPVPLAALQSMPELTELRLEGLRLDTGLQQISTLSKLVVLSIKQVPSIAYESFTGLQLLQGLSHLELSTPFMLDSQMLPGFSKLQRLKSLSVRPSIAADVLQQAGQLQRLQVLQGDNYSDFLAGQEVQVWQGHSSDLLSALPQLHHLTYLDLSAILSYSIYGAISLAGPADAFSALTTSSNLADLRLPKLVAPSGTWQHAFQPSRQLPQLRQLNLGQVQPLLSTDDIRNLSLACPALEALNLHESVAPNPVPTHVFEINFGDGLDNAGEVLIERIEENYNEDLVSAGVAALAQVSSWHEGASGKAAQNLPCYEGSGANKSGAALHMLQPSTMYSRLDAAQPHAAQVQQLRGLRSVPQGS